ncbi:LURP-one-related/scramblase family protein [Capilliphycus salinus ALCB114379]|uniref:LURP-one-related/scramblase family protein n=1 Tax=Capilliphycus salinus TaxID=2768948 RepID=UPI0039A5E834
MLRRKASRDRLFDQNPQPTASAQRITVLQEIKQAAQQRIGTRFQVKQRLFTFGDDFFITNERDERVIKVDGKLLRLRDTLIFENMQGQELYKITARMVDIRETMDLKRPDGSKAAIVHDAWFSPIRDRWRIDIPGGEDLTTVGNILQHEYTICQGGRLPIAIISKKWFRLRDTYGVEVADAFDAPLILGITVVIDMMSHNHTNNKTTGGISTGSGLDLF